MSNLKTISTEERRAQSSNLGSSLEFMFPNKILPCEDYYEVILENSNGDEFVNRVSVDKDDLDLVKGHKWYMASYGDRTEVCYAYAKIDDKTVLMHHLILDNDNKALVIDHIDRNGLNNKRDNLRLLPSDLNTSRHNRRRSHGSNDLPRGVTENTRHMKSPYVGQIGIKGVARYIGSFGNKYEASHGYQISRLIKYFEYREAVDCPKNLIITPYIKKRVVKIFGKFLGLEEVEVLRRLSILEDEGVCNVLGKNQVRQGKKSFLKNSPAKIDLGIEISMTVKDKDRLYGYSEVALICGRTESWVRHKEKGQYINAVEKGKFSGHQVAHLIKNTILKKSSVVPKIKTV